jgi:hypothetical protein
LPHLRDQLGEPGVAPLAPQAREERQLVGAGPGQQRPDQTLLATEQEQQYPGTGLHRRRQRSQRQVREPVPQDVGVGEFEEFGTAGGGFLVDVVHTG